MSILFKKLANNKTQLKTKYSLTFCIALSGVTLCAGRDFCWPRTMSGQLWLTVSSCRTHDIHSCHTQIVKTHSVQSPLFNPVLVDLIYPSCLLPLQTGRYLLLCFYIIVICFNKNPLLCKRKQM